MLRSWISRSHELAASMKELVSGPSTQFKTFMHCTVCSRSPIDGIHDLHNFLPYWSGYEVSAVLRPAWTLEDSDGACGMLCRGNPLRNVHHYCGGTYASGVKLWPRGPKVAPADLEIGPHRILWARVDPTPAETNPDSVSSRVFGPKFENLAHYVRILPNQIHVALRMRLF